jgi:hypothetical protein
METNLPELCRRVWKVAPKSQPESVKVHGEMIVGSIGMDSQGYIDAIQAAALRWLLANDGMGFTSHYGKGTGRYFVASENTYPDTTCVWHATDKDLTTCLLLAVERCQEYKENSK